MCGMWWQARQRRNKTTATKSRPRRQRCILFRWQAPLPVGGQGGLGLEREVETGRKFGEWGNGMAFSNNPLAAHTWNWLHAQFCPVLLFADAGERPCSCPCQPPLSPLHSHCHCPSHAPLAPCRPLACPAIVNRSACVFGYMALLCIPVAIVLVRPGYLQLLPFPLPFPLNSPPIHPTTLPPNHPATHSAHSHPHSRPLDAIISTNLNLSEIINNSFSD